MAGDEGGESHFFVPVVSRFLFSEVNEERNAFWLIDGTVTVFNASITLRMTWDMSFILVEASSFATEESNVSQSVDVNEDISMINYEYTFT